jgi:hypothetical protein
MLSAESDVVDPPDSAAPYGSRENEEALTPSLLVGFVDGQIDLAVESRLGKIIQVDKVGWVGGPISVYLTSVPGPLLMLNVLTVSDLYSPRASSASVPVPET